MTTKLEWIHELLTNKSGTFYQTYQSLIDHTPSTYDTPGTGIFDTSRLADILNTPVAMDNPVTVAPKILKQISTIDFSNVVPDNESALFMQYNDALYNRIEKALDTQDRALLAVQLKIASRSVIPGTTTKILSDSTVIAITNLLSSIVDDPAWTATIQRSLAQQAGFDTVTSQEVQASWNLFN
jgi:hypothetical protein